MGFLDNILQEGGGLSGMAEMAAKNPQALQAVISLLSGKDSSVGGNGGLAGLIQLFQQKGMGDMISSWISKGPNPPISPSQLKDVLGSDVLKQFAAKAGVPEKDAGGLLAGLLPTVVDHITPEGKMPETNSIESTLGGLLSSFGQ